MLGASYLYGQMYMIDIVYLLFTASDFVAIFITLDLKL